MGRVDPEVVHQAEGVSGHVAQQVRGAAAAAKDHVKFAGDAGRLDPGRATDVAVVEADDAEAALGEHRAELFVPGDHLRRQTHDQEQRLAVGIAHLLVAELDPVGGRQLFV